MGTNAFIESKHFNESQYFSDVSKSTSDLEPGLVESVLGSKSHSVESISDSSFEKSTPNTEFKLEESTSDSKSFSNEPTSNLESKQDSVTNEIALDSKFEKFSLSESFADYLFSSSPNDLSNIPKKGGISKGAIIGAVIGVVGAILIITTVTILAIKKRKMKDDNSIKEDHSKQALFNETKPNKSRTDNSLNSDEEDLDFWL